jgi:hypothetical protein
MKKIIIFLSVVIFITGCEQKLNIRRPATIPTIEKTIQRAKNGIISANDTISTLLGLSLHANNNYNKLKIDSLVLSSVKYFTILLEFPNPVNNKFGIYDDTLKTLLLDRSLYGELNENIITINSKKYIKVDEGFTVKDIYEISRLSLYEVGNDKANLIFRTFTRFKEPGAVYTQKIIEFSGSQIITRINSTNDYFSNKSDIFEFDKNSNSYVSKQNLFTDFIKRQLHKLPQTGSVSGNSHFDE